MDVADDRAWGRKPSLAPGITYLARPMHAARPARTLLLYPLGDAAARIAGGYVAEPIAIGPVVKLLAFHDDGFAVAAPARCYEPSRVLAFEVTADFAADALVPWFVRQLANPTRNVKALCASLRQREAYRLVRFLLAQAPEVKASTLGARYGLSEAHFRRKCKEILGRSVKGQLRMLRATRSMLEVAHRERSLTAVALDHGYSSPAHFSSEIRALFGKSPSDLCRQSIVETP